MTDRRSYKIESTSSSTAKVEDIWLTPPEDPDAATTRRILRTEIVDNVHSDKARVKICLLHQRRHTKTAPWEDIESFKLPRLKGGEEVRLQLSTAETYQLHNELINLHALSKDGVPQGERNLVVTDEEETVVVQGPTKGIIQELLGSASDELWNALKELQPNLFNALALAKLHELREQAVKDFEKHLTAGDWEEGNWQSFFESNTWIFGYGLSYHFLSTIQSQPNYGGTTLSGRGGQRGDFLTASAAERRFTVLVEIKKPGSVLVGDKPYRNKVHLIGRELAGGVSQIQANCRTWETQGSREEENREELGQREISTIQPKGILVIGHTGQLDSISKRNTFELFRRNLQNPEVITFDELLERARHLLLNEAKEFTQPEPIDEEEEEFPF